MCQKSNRQQNKRYPQRCLLAHFEATLYLAVVNLLAHNNKSQICYCGQISLQSAAVNCSFSNTFGGNIYFAGSVTILISREVKQVLTTSFTKKNLHPKLMKFIIYCNTEVISLSMQFRPPSYQKILFAPQTLALSAEICFSASLNSSGYSVLNRLRERITICSWLSFCALLQFSHRAPIDPPCLIVSNRPATENNLRQTLVH